jgi:hypothetical protein
MNDLKVNDQMVTDPKAMMGNWVREQSWDAFLDCYSAYIRTPNLGNAAALHLAGAALETQDSSFDLRGFESKLGWQIEVVPA